MQPSEPIALNHWRPSVPADVMNACGKHAAVGRCHAFPDSTGLARFEAFVQEVETARQKFVAYSEDEAADCTDHGHGLVRINTGETPFAGTDLRQWRRDSRAFGSSANHCAGLILELRGRYSVADHSNVPI